MLWQKSFLAHHIIYAELSPINYGGELQGAHGCVKMTILCSKGVPLLHLFLGKDNRKALNDRIKINTINLGGLIWE